jgi:hypothetical protein
MFCAIDTVAVPITIGCILAGIVLVGGIALYDQRRKSLRRAMPHGAEAALWSITEVLPDPRNHLAIKDPTSELRLTDDERREAAEAANRSRLRASTSDDRPARRAAAERSTAAHEAAIAKREAQALEKQRKLEEREQAEREIAKREADDRERVAVATRTAAAKRASEIVVTVASGTGDDLRAERTIDATAIDATTIHATAVDAGAVGAEHVDQRAVAAQTDTIEQPQVVVAADAPAPDAPPAITFDSPEIVERLQALSAEALATDSLFASLAAAAVGASAPIEPVEPVEQVAAETTSTLGPPPPIDLREDTGEMHAAHPRAS